MSREYENKQKASAADILKTLSRNSVALIGSVLILMMIIATIFSPQFPTIFNLQSLMRDIAFIGMVAVAQSLLLLIGELDLSVGKIATLSGVLGWYFDDKHENKSIFGFCNRTFVRNFIWCDQRTSGDKTPPEIHGHNNRNAVVIWRNHVSYNKKEKQLQIYQMRFFSLVKEISVCFHSVYFCYSCL